MVYFFVGIAGFIGAILRYLIGLGLSDTSTVFPFSTLVINLIGSFLLAWLTTVAFKKVSIPSHFQTAIGTGLVGSFTTFSTLSVETVKLFQNNHLILGVIYIMVSMFGGLFMCRLGFSLRKRGCRSMTLFHVLCVGIGGFFGALARFLVSQLIKKKFSFQFPVATLIVNLLGSLLLGLIIGSGLSNIWILLLGTGFLGAFTTFSTFKLEGIQLHLSNRKKEFFIYNLMGYGGGIVLAFIGILFGQYFA